ncbi:CBO0543 family protein [Peribacillus sp. SCS-155]|uniref:CBO0543 family protein n=1 Tax=Peribacillus sedimenti TaxID=3115297 RepID=UPI003905BAC2
MLLMILTIAVFNSIVYFMPKRLLQVEMYTTSLFAIGLHLIIDIFFDVKYGLYGYFDPKVVNWAMLGVTFGIYPAVNVIFLNFYPFHQTLLRKGWYIVMCSAFAVFYEWIAVKTDFFYHSGWKLIYSALMYPLLFLGLLGNYFFIMKLKNKAE